MDQDNTPTPVILNRNLHIVFAVTLVAVMGVASITPVFPEIAEALKISSAKVGLLITIFTLPGIVLTPIMGIYADIYGRKRILFPSLIIFGLAGFACGLTKDFNLLLILRFLQGLGAASIGSLNVTIIGDLFSGKERSAAMGYNASVLSIGTAVYPALGGLLGTFGWNYPFFLPILAIPVGFFVLNDLKNPEPKNDQSVRLYLQNAFKSIRRADAIVLFMASAFTFIILYGSYLTYLPVYMRGRFEAEPWVIGLTMSAMSVTTAWTSTRLGKLNRKYSGRKILIVSYLFYAAALILIPYSTSLALLIIPIILFGMGHGLNIPSIQTLLAGMAPLEYRAAFMSFNGMVLRIGQSTGPLLMGLILAIGGLNGVFFAGALLSLITCFYLPWFIKKDAGTK